MRLEFFSIAYGSDRSGDLAGTARADLDVVAIPPFDANFRDWSRKTATTLLCDSPSDSDVISIANRKRFQKVRTCSELPNQSNFPLSKSGPL